jgi:6-oxo-cyclohex-1-ene-carbonyl-CoA hydrolase
MTKLTWLKKDNDVRDHRLWGNELFSTEAPGIMYELKPITGPKGEKTDGLNCAWITLNNPAQYNSYTTRMVKGVISAFNAASNDRTVVSVVFTGTGDKAFCTGGNTKEYAEYYSKRPEEYGQYMDLFNGMIDAILNCKKPVICRVNGMRVAGGQEIGTACDLTVSSDLAIFGQAGPRHGSSPDGGATDFLPLFLGMENALYSCVACEMWSAYKMKRLGLLTKVVPVIKQDGKWVRNPLYVTDSYVADGELVYGEAVKGEAAEKAKVFLKTAKTDFELLDKACNDLTWTFTNLFPGCLMKAIEGIRMKKKFYWDQSKVLNRHWLAANMSTEAFLGFSAFNAKKETGKDVIDFIKYRKLIAEGRMVDDDLAYEVLPKPQVK